MGVERLGILISGSGTTMEKMIQACQGGIKRQVAMDVACVVSSNPEALGLLKAQKLGVPTEVVNPKNFLGEDKKIDQNSFGNALLEVLIKHDVTVVTQNGWMPKTPDNVIEAFPDRIFNQHPGPVPEFGGKGMFGIRVHAARLEFYQETKRDPFTIAIAQRVYSDFDAGPVVKVGYVKILDSDTPEILQAKILPVEHQIQIALLKDITLGKVSEVPRLPTFVKHNEFKLLSEIKQRVIAKYSRNK